MTRCGGGACRSLSPCKGVGWVAQKKGGYPNGNRCPLGHGSDVNLLYEIDRSDPERACERK